MIDSLHPDPAHDGDMLLILFVKGDQVEVVYTFVQALIELNVKCTPLGDDLHYMYMSQLGVTVIFFKGRGWMYPAAQLYEDMAKNVPVYGWSNWNLPFIRKGQLDLGSVDLEMLNEKNIPAYGHLNFITTFIEERLEVLKEDVSETREELEKEVEVDPETLLNLDMEIV
jgi:hypothetical protein